MNMRLTATCLATALLAACATPPAPLQGQFQPLSAHEAASGDFTGSMVRWGGRIIRTEPRPDKTCFEVISTRLSADTRPYWATDDTKGRFIACRTGFYDPALFEANREVTFSGRIDGYEVRKVDGFTYRFPRVSADVVYLWPQRERVNVVTQPTFGFGFGFGRRW